VGNLLRDLALHGEHARQLPLVLLAPERLTGAGVDQLRAHPDAAPLNPHAPVHVAAQPQLACGARQIVGVAVEPGAAQDAECRDLRELAADLLGHPGREIALLRIRRETLEGTYRNQRTGGFRGDRLDRDLRVTPHEPSRGASEGQDEHGRGRSAQPLRPGSRAG
jgi:hypothetical protein